MPSGITLLLSALGFVFVAFVWQRQRRTSPRRRDEEMLRGVAAALTRTGDAFLPGVVETIATLLDADLVFVAELVGEDQIQAVAVHRDGGPAEGFICPVAASPVARLMRDATFCRAANVRNLFPEDAQLAAVNASGCAAVALSGARHEPVGVLIAATSRSLDDPQYAISLLTLFAGRVAAEMQHARSERELRRSEEHLLQVQRVEAIGRLAGGIAHDFNNLLMIVIGYAEILRDRGGPSLELTELLAAANRATTLTRQLLAFGRRQVLQAQRLDLNRVVTQVQTMLGPVIGAQVQLQLRLDPALPHVDADPGQLEQVLVNLALNARDAMPDGGTLRLETRTERVEQAYEQMPAALYVCLSVSDTGIGMSPDVQAHIFEPFYTTKGSRGTGLGLSSVYGIVKQSGGFIWCRSEPGRGTTFDIYLLPAKADAVRPPAPETAQPDTTGTERLLVVDDEPGVRHLLARLLSARGYTVHEAEDGSSALDILRREATPVDLVITDIVMPGMSGIRLAEEIETRWPVVKLMFVSGYAQHATNGSSDITSRIPVLGKPFAPSRIAAAVRELLDSTSPSPPVRES